MSFIECYDEKGSSIGGYYHAPFNMEVDCHGVDVWGVKLCRMELRGKCEKLKFVDVSDYKRVDLSGFMELEIGVIYVSNMDKGLLKILELNCKKVWSRNDKQLEKIMNKYLEESDPLMRDIQGCKYELAINGFGGRL